MLKLFKAGWILIGSQYFYGSSAESSESDSNYIIPRRFR